MNITEIQSNERLRQRQFPVARRCAYFAHAGVCPVPRQVSDAIAEYASLCVHGDQEDFAPEELIPNTRVLAGRLLGVQPDEIALVGPTSVALGLIANGLPLKPGDNILAYFDDYPSNVYPWMALAQRGVEVRSLKTAELGRIEPDTVLNQVDSRTRLVSLASCHFVSGWRIDHATIGRALRERGIWFCMDAIQTLGACPVSGRDVDFLAADAHKWMLGPCGAGILYVRKDLQEILQPSLLGWNNVLCPNFVAQDRIVLQTGARRYEAGSANLLGLVGLKAALELLLDVGIENITAELRRQRERIAAELQSRAYRVLHAAAPPANTAGILSFYRPGVDSRTLHGRLANRGIVTSLRSDRSGQSYVRVSPHFYNTDAELLRLFDEL
ncbi:MAG TPA: aminotransferase class V-fold PLP-dependent enzyme [Verrucomicrobiota bacterium]|nr:aminotransferase class V-fold PLP-dependent enzyme [Verrucomicrobiota bacterium]